MDTLAQRTRNLRNARRLSLREAAELTGVSKSMLSKIETGAASPTATVLGKIAEGFGVSLSELIGGPTSERNGAKGEKVVVLHASEQPVFSIPKTGFERRSLSPLGPHRRVDFVANRLPPGQSSGAFPPHRPGVEETLVVASGSLRLYLEGKKYELNEGDSILYQADVEHRFDNPSATQAALFYIVVNNTETHAGSN